MDLNSAFSITCSLVFVAGCNVGPDPRRPATLADDAPPWVSAPLSAEPHELDDLRGWWRHFADPATTELVELALQNNLDLRIAAAQMMEADALLAAAGGARLPRVMAEATTNFQRQVIELQDVDLDLPPPFDEQLEDTLTFRTRQFQAGLNVRWSADLFGRLRRAEQAALAELMSARSQRLAALHMVVAQTIRARVSHSVAAEQLMLAEEDLAALRHRLEVLESRHRLGLLDAADLLLMRSDVAAAEARLPELARQAELSGLALDVLVGVQPGYGPRPDGLLAGLPQLPAPPPGVPARLLDQRPDLLAAEFRHHAATARVGVTLAEMYPDLVLSGQVGFSGRELANLFDPDHLIYTVGARMTQLLFAGGAQRAQVRAARARAEQSAAAYARQVLEAMLEVESALLREREARRAYELADAALAEAVELQRLAEQRFARGVGTIVELLDAEQRRRQARQDRLAATEAVWGARIDLHLALGGDWEVGVTLEALAERPEGREADR